MSENQAVEKQSNKKIAAGTILGYFGLGLSIISGLFFTPWIKENIGNSMYGLYTLGQSVINLFLLDFGLSNSVSAYLSKYRAEGNIDDENHFLTTALKMYLFIDLVLLIVFVVVYFLIEYIYAGLTAEEIPILKNVFIILAGFSLLTFPSSLYSGILKAYEEFGWIKIIEIANKVVYIVLTSISLMLNLGIYAVIFSYAFSSFINAFVLLLFARYKLKKKILLAPKTTWQDIRQVASFSAYSFVSSIAARLVFTIAPSVLGIVSDSTNIAVFGTCSSLEGYVYSFSSVMSGFFMPKIKRIAPSQDDPSYGVKLNELAIKVGRIQVSFVLLVIIGFVAVGNDFIEVWMRYDPVYSSAYLGTILLIIYQAINVGQTIFVTAMNANKRNIRPYSLVNIATSVINFGLLFIFGFFYGSTGACIAIFIAHCIELIGMNVLYKKYLHVNLARFFKRTYLGFLPAAAASLAAALLFHFLLPFDAIVNIFIGGICTVVIYLSLFWLGFGLQDTKRFFSSLKTRYIKKKHR